MGENSDAEVKSELVLLIGDFCIPSRKPAIPKQFRELLNTDKIQHVLCTGNVGSSSVVEMLKQITSDVYVVKGDMDIDALPDHEVVEIGGFHIGLLHGHQALGNTDLLSEWQRKLDCDVLVSGFTHHNSAEKVRGKFYINPGSVTGAYRPPVSTSDAVPVVPSFMLMSIRGCHAVLYVYELREGKVHVAMSELSTRTD